MASISLLLRKKTVYALSLSQTRLLSLLLTVKTVLMVRKVIKETRVTKVIKETRVTMV